ncbi:hypothetical protein BDP55DRAFT_418896 [Colletotrichum godetiae]|uniref:Uncharacterized protein n=1 Tax=Colletotrichum godetiae TaxID=1209918 RepID=A0AAJ0EQQ4_9PEZI|nr:uncharacterized protein BDP55DRAFT_418896 [Colletotrichum godetiae]KAK1657814.1 hypothetical protein BDP55DRAFT_418896 [Colletotrichum godetiae]
MRYRNLRVCVSWVFCHHVVLIPSHRPKRQRGHEHHPHLHDPIAKLATTRAFQLVGKNFAPGLIFSVIHQHIVSFAHVSPAAIRSLDR